MNRTQPFPVALKFLCLAFVLTFPAGWWIAALSAASGEPATIGIGEAFGFLGATMIAGLLSIVISAIGIHYYGSKDKTVLISLIPLALVVVYLFVLQTDPGKHFVSLIIR